MLLIIKISTYKVIVDGPIISNECSIYFWCFLFSWVSVISNAETFAERYWTLCSDSLHGSGSSEGKCHRRSSCWLLSAEDTLSSLNEWCLCGKDRKLSLFGPHTPQRNLDFKYKKSRICSRTAGSGASSTEFRKASCIASIALRSRQGSI